MLMDIDFDDAATGARAGAKFKPKARLPQLRKHVSVSTPSNEKLSIQSSAASGNFSNDSISEIHVPDNDTINQANHGTFSEENVHVLSGGVHCFMKPPIDLHTRSDMDSEKQRCDDKDMFLDDPRRTQDLETLGVSDLGVDEEASKSHESADDSGPCIVNGEPRNEAFNMNANFSAHLLNEKFPQVPQETTATGNSPCGWEHEERVESPSNNTVVGEDKCFGNTVEEQSGRGRNVRKSKRVTSEKTRLAQKRKQSNEEPNQCSKKPLQKKKFKHSTSRHKRTLEKELLEIPDDEIRFLPIRDLLRLVDYKEWLEKKEVKERKGPQTQESTSRASNNQYTQDDSYNLDSDENREDQETSRVKPDSPVNYQTYLHKTARSRWSKQDTELFYEGICEFGSNLSMVQQLFPNRSRQQLKLKYKLEERKHPLKLNDALTSRSKHNIHYQNVIKKFQQEAAARKAEEQAETAGEGAETNDVPNNAEPAGGDAEFKEPDHEKAENGMRSDGTKAENDQRSNGGDADDDDDEAECDYWAS